MTNEEAVFILTKMMPPAQRSDSKSTTHTKMVVALAKGIEALLYQEPFMNKPCVAKQVCHENKIKVLDKIREEIAAIELSGIIDAHTSFLRTSDQVKKISLDIIDKYREESEEEE